MRRTVSLRASVPIEVLHRFLDTSGSDTADASASALKEMRLWEADADPLDVQHVIKKHIKPATAGVPCGPYDDDTVVDVLDTIVTFREKQSEKRWKSVERVLAGLPVIGKFFAKWFGN